MKQSICLFTFAIALFCTGCLKPPIACVKGELRFEAPIFPLGKTYTALGLVYNNGNGLAVGIDSLTYTSGLRGFNQSEILQGPSLPFGTGQVLRMNNTRLNFDLKQGTQKAEFEYLDQGGTINLGARNATGMYIGGMYAMPASMVINGVTVKKSNVQNILNPQGVKVAEKGTITLIFSPDIGGMMIGGQELFLDNFCFN